MFGQETIANGCLLVALGFSTVCLFRLSRRYLVLYSDRQELSDLYNQLETRYYNYAAEKVEIYVPAELTPPELFTILSDFTQRVDEYSIEHNVDLNQALSAVLAEFEQPARVFEDENPEGPEFDPLSPDDPNALFAIHKLIETQNTAPDRAYQLVTGQDNYDNSGMYCNHNKENPSVCPCHATCWCRVQGCCKRKSFTIQATTSP